MNDACLSHAIPFVTGPFDFYMIDALPNKEFVNMRKNQCVAISRM